MVSTQVKIDIAETDEQGALVIPPEIANEMGVHVGDKLTLEVVAGTLVIRRESGFALAKGAGAPWRVYPPLTPEGEAEAFVSPASVPSQRLRVFCCSILISTGGGSSGPRGNPPNRQRSQAMTEAMTMPTNRSTLLVFMQEQWDGFVRASDALPDDVWLSAKNADGWSIRDHAGHVMLWTQAEIPLLTEGTPIQQNAGIPDEVWNSTDPNAVNEWFRRKLQEMSPAEIRAQRDRDFPRLVEAVARFSDAELAQPARISGLEASDRPLLTVMSENYGLHFDDHRAQIEVLGKAASA